MASKEPRQEEAEESGFENKCFRLRPEAARAFDVLKGRLGPRSGPRLAAEMVDLLLVKHGEKPVGPLRPGAAGKTSAPKPKAGS